MYGHMCAAASMWRSEEKIVAVGFLLPPWGSQGSNSDHQGHFLTSTLAVNSPHWPSQCSQTEVSLTRRIGREKVESVSKIQVMRKSPSVCLSAPRSLCSWRQCHESSLPSLKASSRIFATSVRKHVLWCQKWVSTDSLAIEADISLFNSGTVYLCVLRQNKSKQ